MTKVGDHRLHPLSRISLRSYGFTVREQLLWIYPDKNKKRVHVTEKIFLFLIEAEIKKDRLEF